METDQKTKELGSFTQTHKEQEIEPLRTSKNLGFIDSAAGPTNQNLTFQQNASCPARLVAEVQGRTD